jgi:hypothetical protein
MKHYLHYAFVGFAMLAWVLIVYTLPVVAFTSFMENWTIRIPSFVMVLGGVAVIASLDALYIQVRKRRAYRRLYQVVSLERTSRRKSPDRCQE